MRVVLALVVAAVLAGCAGQDAAPQPEHRLHGTFTEAATQDDADALGDHVEARGGTMALLESFPMQFSVAGLDLAACREVRAYALQAPYVADVGDCVPVDG